MGTTKDNEILTGIQKTIKPVINRSKVAFSLNFNSTKQTNNILAKKQVVVNNINKTLPKIRSPLSGLQTPKTIMLGSQGVNGKQVNPLINMSPALAFRRSLALRNKGRKSQLSFLEKQLWMLRYNYYLSIGILKPESVNPFIVKSQIQVIEEKKTESKPSVSPKSKSPIKFKSPLSPTRNGAVPSLPISLSKSQEGNRSKTKRSDRSPEKMNEEDINLIKANTKTKSSPILFNVKAKSPTIATSGLSGKSIRIGKGLSSISPVRVTRRSPTHLMKPIKTRLSPEYANGSKDSTNPINKDKLNKNSVEVVVESIFDDDKGQANKDQEPQADHEINGNLLTSFDEKMKEAEDKIITEAKVSRAFQHGQRKSPRIRERILKQELLGSDSP
ncbi:hypothetical protein K502DRAFT_326306 [Neoconidiobolus thromboides FSU 785]|nr:hypothetical protein K502DRAFT_326306 [Neoconidiobolus thromboides FSU 785]